MSPGATLADPGAPVNAFAKISAQEHSTGTRTYTYPVRILANSLASLRNPA